jgi:hypothetical protein
MKSNRQKIPKITWIVLLIFGLAIRLISLDKSLVESWYSRGIYPRIGSSLRWLFGWLPFSLGDLFYIGIILYAIIVLINWIRAIRQKKISWLSVKGGLLRFLGLMVTIYIVFNLLWGINYNREGIGSEIGIERTKYSKEELAAISDQLLMKVNACKEATIRQHISYPGTKELFRKTDSVYKLAQETYPFLRYSNPSLKSTFFGLMGNFLGFTGYYNPLTGEAQVNTSVPPFLQYFISCHEVAHQLGYAKENEANFVGYLVAANSGDSLFLYSTYFDLFLYAHQNLYMSDSSAAKSLVERLHPAVKADIKLLRTFYRKFENPIEPGIRWLYGKYLEANEQPSGVMTYNEVVADLIAYYRKYGKI